MPWRKQLTFRGFLDEFCVRAVNEIKEVASGFAWGDALADSAILALLTFFTSLGGTVIADIAFNQALFAAAISGATQFFVVLALKRGLIKQEAKA